MPLYPSERLYLTKKLPFARLGPSSECLAFLPSIQSDELRADGMILALRQTQKLSCRMALTLLGGNGSPVLSRWQGRGFERSSCGSFASSMFLQPVGTLF